MIRQEIRKALAGESVENPESQGAQHKDASLPEKGNDGTPKLFELPFPKDIRLLSPESGTYDVNKLRMSMFEKITRKRSPYGALYDTILNPFQKVLDKIKTAVAERHVTPKQAYQHFMAILSYYKIELTLTEQTCLHTNFSNIELDEEEEGSATVDTSSASQDDIASSSKSEEFLKALQDTLRTGAVKSLFYIDEKSAKVFEPSYFYRAVRGRFVDGLKQTLRMQTDDELVGDQISIIFSMEVARKYITENNIPNPDETLRHIEGLFYLMNCIDVERQHSPYNYMLNLFMEQNPNDPILNIAHNIFKKRIEEDNDRSSKPEHFGTLQRSDPEYANRVTQLFPEPQKRIAFVSEKKTANTTDRPGFKYHGGLFEHGKHYFFKESQGKRQDEYKLATEIITTALRVQVPLVKDLDQMLKEEVFKNSLCFPSFFIVCASASHLTSLSGKSAQDTQAAIQQVFMNWKKKHNIQ